MSQAKEHIGGTLLADATLLAMLAPNKSWVNPALPEETKHSIIPMNKGPLANGVYLTVAEIGDARTGYNMGESFITIRCYNNIDKTYVEIDKVLARVKALLHRNRFNYVDGTVNVDVFYETTGAELEDQAYNQIFREAQYRVIYI